MAKVILGEARRARTTSRMAGWSVSWEARYSASLVQRYSSM